MAIGKRFSFSSGRSLSVSVDGGTLRFLLEDGDFSLPFSAEDVIANRTGSGKLPLCCSENLSVLGGRVTAEDRGDVLILHACPVGAGSRAPYGGLMAHYRFEKAGNDALRVSAYFGSREPFFVHGLSWLALTFDKSLVTGVRGFAPDHVPDKETCTHALCFGAASLCFGDRFLTLSDSGTTEWIPNIGGYEDKTPRCMLAAGNGRIVHTDLSVFSEPHPLTAVISFGRGAPAVPQAAACPAVAFPVPEGRTFTLRSGRLCAGLIVRENGVSLPGVSLTDFTPVPEAALQPLTALSVKDLRSGRVESLTSEHDWERVTVTEGAGLLSVTLSRPRGLPLSVTVTGRAAENDAVEWSVSVINDSPDHSVLSVSYPAVSFRSSADPALFLPMDSGKVVYNACSREIRNPAVYPSGFNGVVPVYGVYDPEKRTGSGLYAAVHSAAPALKYMNAVCFRNGDGYFLFDMPAEGLGMPANSFRLDGALVVRVLDGDWYDMANIYRGFVLGYAEWLPPLGRPDSPSWMRDVPMYIMDWMPNDNPDADPVPISIRPDGDPPRDNWYKKPIELAERLGMPIGYHLYNWHFIPFNNDYPYYFPVKEGLEHGVAEMHRHGIKVMPYINGLIADTRDTRGETFRFDRELRPGAVKGLDGGLQIETYASHEPDGSLCTLAEMCPASVQWRTKLAEIVRRLFHEYGMDAIYVDQVAAASQKLCCDPSHGHVPGNGAWWARSYRLLMQRLRQECPPGRGFTTESNADCYADVFDGYLTWAWVDTCLVPFFPRIYAGRIAMLGRNTNGYKKKDAQYFRFHAAQSVMFGQQLGWINANVVDDPRKIGFLALMCRMRCDCGNFFTRGEMLRPPKAEGGEIFVTDCAMGHDSISPTSAVVAGAWTDAKAGRVLIAVANSADTPADVTLTYDPAEYGVSGTIRDTTVYGDAETTSAVPGKLCLHLAAQSAAAVYTDLL